MKVAVLVPGDTLRTVEIQRDLIEIRILIGGKKSAADYLVDGILAVFDADAQRRGEWSCCHNPRTGNDLYGVIVFAREGGKGFPYASLDDRDVRLLESYVRSHGIRRSI